MLVLSWRNEPQIATFMKNKRLDLNEHLEFCDNLKKGRDEKSIFWCLKMKNANLGCIKIQF